MVRRLFTDSFGMSILSGSEVHLVLGQELDIGFSIPAQYENPMHVGRWVVVL